MKTYNKNQVLTFRTKAPDGQSLYGIVDRPTHAVLKATPRGWVVINTYASSVSAHIALIALQRNGCRHKLTITSVEVL